MPIYEYKCPKCGQVFEEWLKSSESHKDMPCPYCGELSPRIMSRTSFVLKGDGWYVSDYGYRKGISEECGKGAVAPDKAKPVTPAKQGEKSLAKTDSKKESKPAANTEKKQQKPKKKATKKKDASA